MKVLSLLPSATEIVYALEAQDSLCGVSCDCDYPEGVTTKPVVSAKVLPITPTTSPGEIDQLVRDQLEVSDSIYSLDRSLIQQLRPDVILAQDLCRVCAVPSGHVEEALDVIGCTAEVLSLDPHSLDEVLEGILTVGSALGVSDRAESFVAHLRSRLDRVRSLTGDAARRRVVALEWQEPPFNGGHWIPEMIELAGGTDLLGAPGARSRTLTWSEVEAVTPRRDRLYALWLRSRRRCRADSRALRDRGVQAYSSGRERECVRNGFLVLFLPVRSTLDRWSGDPCGIASPRALLAAAFFQGAPRDSSRYRVGYLGSVMTTNDVRVEVYRSFVEDGRAPPPVRRAPRRLHRRRARCRRRRGRDRRTRRRRGAVVAR